MKRIKKIALIFLGVIAFLVFTLFIFNKVYLSKILVSKLTDLLQEQTGRKVEIKDAAFSLIKGFSISQLTIYDEEPSKATLKVKSFSCGLSFLPFLKDKKIYLPLAVSLKNADIFIVRKTENEFNFSSLKLLKEKKQQAQTKSKIIVLPHSIQLKDAKIHTKDYFTKSSLPITLHIENINTQIQFLSKVIFNIKADISPGGTRIRGSGDFTFLTKTLSASITISHLPIELYQAYYQNIPIEIKNALLENMDAQILFKDKTASLKTTAKLTNIALNKNNLQINGQLLINTDTAYNTENKNLDYKGNLKIVNASLAGIQFVGKIDKVNGDVAFSKDLIETKNITAFVLENQVNLDARFYDFNNQNLYLHLSSDFNPSILTKLFAEKIKDKQINADGKVNLDFKLEGRLKEPKALSYSAELDIGEAKIIYPALLNEPIRIVQTKATFKDNKITSPSININYKSCTIHSSLLFDISDKNNMALAAEGDINLELSDFSSKKLLLVGANKGNFKLDMPIKDINNAVINVNLNSPFIGIQGMRLNNVSTSYAQSNSRGGLDISSTDIYTGKTKITADLENPFSKNINYKINASIENMDLGRLKQDTALKDKDFSGILTSSVNIEGKTLDLNNLSGTGTLDIKDGNLWELKLFKALANILKLAPKSLIRFSQCNGTFSIKDKKINTQDLQMVSQDNNLILNASGDIGFDKTLDLLFQTSLSQDILKNEPNIMQLPGIILGAASSQLKIRVSGTIDDPKPSIIPAVIDFGKGVEGIKDILKDILK